jgi:hypothetical protein
VNLAQHHHSRSRRSSRLGRSSVLVFDGSQGVLVPALVVLFLLSALVILVVEHFLSCFIAAYRYLYVDEPYWLVVLATLVN